MAFKMDGPSLYKKPVGPRATLKPIDRNKFEQETGVMQGMENVEQELFSSKATHDIVKKNIKNKTNNMKNKSALKKMPEIVKGKGNFTYRYTSPQEQYDKRFPKDKNTGAEKAITFLPKIEIKSKSDKDFTNVEYGSDEYNRIMKEIGGKLKTKPPGAETLPFDINQKVDDPAPFAKMKRRNDGSMAKLKGQSFMKRMKMMNEASSPARKNGDGFKIDSDIAKTVLDKIKIGKGTITGTSGIDSVKPIINKLKNLITKPGYGPGGISPNPGVVSDELSDKITKSKNNTGGAIAGTIAGTIGGILNNKTVTKYGKRLSDLFGK